MKFLAKFLILNILFFSVINLSTKEFDEKFSFSLLKEQCSFGPRVPGTESHERCVQLIVELLKNYVDSVYVQTFKRKVSYSKQKIEFKNIVGILNPEKEENIMFFSHYDSRPFSNIKNRAIDGANDGASSTALLLGLAKFFKENDFKERIDFVFFDAEDGGRINHPDEWFLGSKYFAKNYKGKIPKMAILLDMIGDSDLNIKREINSQIVNTKLYDKIFKTAKKLNKKNFVDKLGFYIEDDHIPLNEKGFRCVDLIDIEYKYWHTVDDTPDKCSSKSLKDVAEVIIETVYDR